MIKTKKELEDLKLGWLRDPCWDVEETEDYAGYREELLAFRLAEEAHWEAREHKRLCDRAAALGISGNIDMVKYLEALERRVADLGRKIEEQSHYIDWRKEIWHE